METKLDIFDIKSHLWEILKCLLFSPSSLTTLLEDGGEDWTGEVLIILGGIWLALPTPRYPGVKYDDLVGYSI